MKNYLQVFDKNGVVLNSKHINKVLSNLDRFTNHLQDLRQIVNKMDDGYCYDPVKIADIAEDFFDSWSASSTELTDHIGKENCLEFFTLCKPFWYMTWPQSSLEFMNAKGILNFLDSVTSNGAGWEGRIFRGESPSLVAQGYQGLSWTFEKNIAKYYAERHPDGVVLSKKIKWEDVLMILDSEQEVIVKPQMGQ